VNQPADSTLFARVLAKTNEYLDFPSVVGHETPFLDHLARDFGALGYQVERSPNLCVISLHEPGPVYLAHADRHGAVIAEDGKAIYAAQAIKNLKYDDNATHTEAFTATVSRRYEGEDVFAYDRKTGGRLAYGTIKRAYLDDERRLVVDIEDLPPLPGGTPVAFARDVTRNKSGHVSGQLDNPVSLAALRVTAEYGLKGTIIVTAEEEIGRSAGHFLSWAQAGGLAPTTELVVCDTSPFDDAAACMAGAVILRRRDATASFHDATVSRLETAASRAGAPMIFKDSFIARENDARTRRELPLKSMGLTELGRITADSQGQYAGATLQLPTYNYHTNEETTSVKALTAFVRTLLAI